MGKTITYDVMREHEGDRFYRSGETRDLNEVEAKHLVELGVLVERSTAKAETKVKNKAEQVPSNKAG
ncbi:hypothetical protein EM858_04255 [Agrobacterium sp. CNPSo 2736]|uniref:hypothetical protein n=1 Tax=Agrobacterium sp. CNPSo 2736 TaxID=2499627 RepID=UPI000FDC19FE|nr:hypothetical protein [Agrobacterium sp. CNPSo 2736]RVT80214.1 hypothetical protein EM858_04255 [Agrobacterium sp. CNPSo 2736]